MNYSFVKPPSKSWKPLFPISEIAATKLICFYLESLWILAGFPLNDHVYYVPFTILYDYSSMNMSKILGKKELKLFKIKTRISFINS